MNKENAPKIVSELGEGYFVDWVGDFDSIEAGVKHALSRIRNDASNSKPTGPNSWEAEDEALRIVLQELEQDQLDQILKFYFDINPEEVGDSRAFFERLHAAVREGILNAKRQSSD